LQQSNHSFFGSGAASVNDLVLFVPVLAAEGPGSARCEGEGGGTVVWQALFGVDDGVKCFLNQETSSLEPSQGGFGFDAVLATQRGPSAGDGPQHSSGSVPPPPITADTVTDTTSQAQGLTAATLGTLLGHAHVWQRLLLCGMVVHSKECTRPPREADEEAAMVNGDALSIAGAVGDQHHHHYGVEPGERYRLLTVVSPE